MASKEQYAQWIIANQDKKGTPEFETVAAAYKAASSQPAAVANPNQDVATYVQGLAKRADEVAAGYSPTDPTVGMSGGQKFLAGVGMGMTNLARGAGQVLGVVSEEDVARSRERDAPLARTGAGSAGNVVGTVAAGLPTMLIPGANTYTGAALTGAAMGALQPTVEGESRALNAATGAAGGVAGRAVVGGASRMLNPQTSAAAKSLMDEGITPTPGQVMGGYPRRLEEAAKSIPFVGQGIRNAEYRAIEDFNKAALNRVLAPIGAKSTAIGYEGIEEASKAVGNAYDDALKGLGRVDIDSAFTNRLAALKSMTQSLPKAIRGQFDRIVTDQIESKITPAGSITPEQLKTATSELYKLGTGYKGTGNSFDQQQLGDALLQLRSNLYDLAGRVSPEAKTAIQSADKAFAQLVRVQDAAARSNNGIFSPSQLATAAKITDKSARKVATSKGRALMQDLAQAGKNVLGNNLPDSGTAERVGSGVALGAGFLVNPAIPAAMIGTRAAYTPTGQNALVSLLARRPELARHAGTQLSRLAAPASLAGAIGAQGVQQ